MGLSYLFDRQAEVPLRGQLLAAFLDANVVKHGAHSIQFKSRRGNEDFVPGWSTRCPDNEVENIRGARAQAQMLDA